MGIDIKDGKVKVAVGYSLKLNVNPDGYSMHDAHSSVSFEFDVGDVDTTAALKSLEDLEAAISQHVKLAVFAQLGAEFDETSDGVLIPKAPASTSKAKSKPAPRQGGGGGSRQYNRGGGSGYDRPAPKADIKLQPVLAFDVGDGTQAWYDLRPLKDDGTYAVNAPDFALVASPQRKLWLKGQDGNFNEDVADALEAAGVPFE